MPAICFAASASPDQHPPLAWVKQKAVWVNIDDGLPQCSQDA